jgi:hypothetical protein
MKETEGRKGRTEERKKKGKKGERKGGEKKSKGMNEGRLRKKRIHHYHT